MSCKCFHVMVRAFPKVRGVVRSTSRWVFLSCLYTYTCALVHVKWCLAADRRNPDRHGEAFIKRSLASAPHPPTQTPPSG